MSLSLALSITIPISLGAYFWNRGWILLGPFLFAVSYTAFEYYRLRWAFPGLSIFALSHTQGASNNAHATVLAQLASIGGEESVTFVLSFFSASITFGVRNIIRKNIFILFGMALCVLTFSVAAGAIIKKSEGQKLKEGFYVAFPVDSIEDSEADFNLLIESHRSACESLAKLDRRGIIVYPETSSGFVFTRSSEHLWQFAVDGTRQPDGAMGLLDFLNQVAGCRHATILGSYTQFSPPTIRDGVLVSPYHNSMILLDGTRESVITTYSKNKLVPFSEGPAHLFGKNLPGLRVPIDNNNIHRVPDHAQLPISFKLNGESGSAKYRLIPIICYEELLQDFVKERLTKNHVINRDRAIVSISDYNFFMAPDTGDMPEYLDIVMTASQVMFGEQLCRAASFRAIENRISLIRSINNGASGVVDPLGIFHGRNGDGIGDEGAAFIAPVSLGSNRSFITPLLGNMHWAQLFSTIFTSGLLSYMMFVKIFLKNPL